MTTAALGSVSINPTQPRVVEIPANITASVYQLSAYTAAQLVAEPPPPIPAVIVSGNVTSNPDQPGFYRVPNPVLTSAAQADAVRSAANNTAIAFGLPATYAQDAATIEQLTVVQKAIKVLPPVNVTQVIIPP